MEKFRKQFPSFSTLVILCCHALLALHKPAYSQETGDSSKVHLIPEAIVSAKKHGQRLFLCRSFRVNSYKG